MDGYINIPCIPAIQPIGEMYVCVIDSKFLQKITYADVRRNEPECRDVEKYVGVQRVLDPKREKEIGKYVNFADATFPNSIIVCLSSKDAICASRASFATVPSVSISMVSQNIFFSTRLIKAWAFLIPG